ncbi:MAG: hypothetical protein COV74_03405 [Candidatus Omnitrophica bacterium CG11_big_fil_rev_8_21_14_0_20_45_26]|uniref:Response regulatory domain-containing protein n=1 Tax=Candidatus Abzuiibacterium crystallinum TaxID=1974748 RepID=A0A2H0LQZ0_9BACT|nr:MAG: hypothetical protein COV74_03405 [Candidatus Omnitrophica bacterium CG11_big_fil_rev_8_21_14_0_20_45_26]PIW64248.1 MAG: hypothetical protein COW12_07035 [Candidatus Omnitrophica bacterium CG12_big_fil_rev_8_21_14_0_65_45_16]
MNSILLVVAENAATRKLIQNASQQYIVDCYFVSYGDHLAELVKKMNPFLLIVEFASQSSDWVVRYLGEIKSSKHMFPIIGIVSPDLEADIIRLQRAGCDHIVLSTDFQTKIPELIDKYVR